MLGADEWDHEVGDGERRKGQPTVLADRKDRLVSGIAGLELADLAIDHYNFTTRQRDSEKYLECIGDGLSISLSRCLFVKNSHPLDDALAEQTLRPEQEDDQRHPRSEDHTS